MDYFVSIASAREYLLKLKEANDETLADIKAQIESGEKDTKRIQGLMVAQFKLIQNSDYLERLSRNLNDLTMLNKVLASKSESDESLEK
jgi:hypothetical protein